MLPDKKYEAIAVARATLMGKCESCPYLNKCSSDDSFVFPNNAICMEIKQGLLSKYHTKAGNRV